MKKAFLLFLVAVLAASCDGPMGPPGRDGRDGQVNKKIIDIDVPSRQWRVDYDENGNRFYYAQFNMPEITKNVYDNGIVSVYHELNGNQIVLPYTRHNGEYGYNWTRTIDVDFTIGSMTFYVTDSDFADVPAAWPETMFFRVVLIW